MTEELIINRCHKRERRGQGEVVKANVRCVVLKLGHEAEHQQEMFKKKRGREEGKAFQENDIARAKVSNMKIKTAGYYPWNMGLPGKVMPYKIGQIG